MKFMQMAQFSLATITVAGFAVADEPVKRPRTKLDQLSWLTGGWSAESSNGQTTEEHWIAPKGGIMLGVNRSVKPGRRSSFEFLRIQETQRGIVYFASPGGREPTPFPLIQLKDKTAVFANPKHDFPKKITYRLDKNTLHVVIEGEINGRTRAMSWKWKKWKVTRRFGPK